MISNENSTPQMYQPVITPTSRAHPVFIGVFDMITKIFLEYTENDKEACIGLLSTINFFRLQQVGKEIKNPFIIFAKFVPEFYVKTETCREAFRSKCWVVTDRQKKKLNRSVNEQGLSILQFILEENDLAFAEALIKEGISVDILDREKNSAFHYVLRKGDSDLIKLFCNRAPHLAAQSNNEGQSPLMVAASLGKLEAIRLLKSKGVNLEEMDKKGRTALHLAAIKRQDKTIDLLCSYGCNLNANDKQCNRPRDLVKGTDPISKATRKVIQNHMIIRDSVEKDPKLDKPFFPENIVFKGGGPKGIAFVGAVTFLEKQGALRDLIRVAGTSAGAIQATLLALNYNSKEMRKHLNKDFSIFLDYSKETTFKEGTSNIVKELHKIAETVNLISDPLIAMRHMIGKVLGIKLGKVGEEVWNKGACKGEKFREWIEDLIHQKTQIHHCTFGELRKLIESGKPFRHLHIFTSNVNTNEPTHINSEHKCWDDVIISDAVRASMSIPVLFKPHTLHVKGNDGERTIAKNFGEHVDGGLIRNFALNAFDKRKYLPTNIKGEEGELHIINRRTLGFSLYAKEPLPTSNNDPKSVLELLKSVSSIYFNAEDLLSTNIEDRFRMIEIDNLGVSLFDFDLPLEKKKLLIQSGKNATREFYQDKSTQPTTESSYIIPPLLECIKKENIEPSSLKNQGAVLRKALPYFSERQKYMEMLAEEFLPRDKGIAVSGLYGPPGFGKTETVLAFAHFQKENYSLVWWMDGSSQDRVYDCYRQLANYLQVYNDSNTVLDVLQSNVHRKLEIISSTKPFLLIFDNVQTMPKLPSKGGRILITSRQKFENLIPIDPFSESEALEVFFKVLKEKPTDQTKALVKELGYYPPAIAHAAHSKMVLGLFSQAWKICEQNLMTANPKALEWLQMCIYLDPDVIPIKWIDFWLKFEEDEKAISKRESILHTLLEHGMIKKEKGTFSLHRAIQVIMRKAFLDKEKDGILRAVVSLLQDILNTLDDKNLEDRKSFPLLQKSIEPLIERMVWISPNAEVDLLLTLGKWSITIGDYAKAKKFAEDALKIAEQYLDKKFLRKIYKLLSQVYKKLGNNKEALRYAQAHRCNNFDRASS